MRHPETELIAFVRGELVGQTHERVARHLESCAACQAARDDFRRALDALGSSVPQPPAIHAARYRAELRRKLEVRREQATARAWWRWPLPLALSVGLTGMLLFLAVHGGFRPADREDVKAFEEAAIAPRLELLRNYGLVERLDLLEDFDILKTLASPTASRES
jgi:anti-sigma factor RsiW